LSSLVAVSIHTTTIILGQRDYVVVQEYMHRALDN
jgi:hypothetical protein